MEHVSDRLRETERKYLVLGNSGAVEKRSIMHQIMNLSKFELEVNSPGLTQFVKEEMAGLSVSLCDQKTSMLS